MQCKVSRVVLGIFLGLSLILGSWILLGRAVLAAPGDQVERPVASVALQQRWLTQTATNTQAAPIQHQLAQLPPRTTSVSQSSFP